MSIGVVAPRFIAEHPDLGMEDAPRLTTLRGERRDHRLLDECQCRLTCTRDSGLSAVTEYNDAICVSASAFQQRKRFGGYLSVAVLYIAECEGERDRQ